MFLVFKEWEIHINPLMTGESMRGNTVFFFWQGHLKQVQGSYVDSNGQSYSALDVADAYFRAGGAAGVAEF